MEKMGVYKKWICWIFECLKMTSISVLVNGSPTGEFKMGYGLRQGDPISPLVFLIVVEGFNMMMEKAVEIGRFYGFTFKGGVQHFSHLQYVDDTLIIGEKYYTDIWNIKTNFTLFEIMTCLKVNYHKSLLIRINTPQNWLEDAAKVLNCNIGSSTFNYLGLPIRVNSIRKAM